MRSTRKAAAAPPEGSGADLRLVAVAARATAAELVFFAFAVLPAADLAGEEPGRAEDFRAFSLMNHLSRWPMASCRAIHKFRSPRPETKPRTAPLAAMMERVGN